MISEIIVFTLRTSVLTT